MVRKHLLVLAIGGIILAGCTKKPPPPPPPEPVVPEISEPEPPPVPAGPSEAELRRQRIAQRIAEVVKPVYFALDQSTLTQDSRSTLSAIGDLLKEFDEVSIKVEGNCDDRGTDEYNFALGERRAKAARDYLESYGIAAGRLSTISYGEERAAMTGEGDDVWSKNRRDEFVPSY